MPRPVWSIQPPRAVITEVQNLEKDERSKIHYSGVGGGPDSVNWRVRVVDLKIKSLVQVEPDGCRRVEW